MVSSNITIGENGRLFFAGQDTVELAKGRSLQAVGIAMHVLADTWAHQNFAGTPSLVINNTNFHFFAIFFAIYLHILSHPYEIISPPFRLTNDYG